MKIDRNKSVPLHTQIEAMLREKILSNRLRAEDVVPSERELSDELQVSRMTVRQALGALRKEGLIYQKRGKGTFVSPLKLDIHTRNLEGFSAEMKRRGMKPKSRVLTLSRISATDEIADKLQLKIEDQEVYFIRRLRVADEVPMSVETTYLPVGLFPKLDKFDFEKNSLYEILKKKYSFQMESASEDLEAAIADAETSKLLQVTAKSPLLIVYRTVFAAGNQAIEYTKSVYRADRYRASFFLTVK